MAEGYVQTEINRTGPKIRNITASVLQPDGTTATVYMQVVALAATSPDGQPIDLDISATLDELKTLATQQVNLLLIIANQLGANVTPDELR